MIFTPESLSAHCVVRSQPASPEVLSPSQKAAAPLSRRMILTAGPLALAGALAGCSAVAQEASSGASGSASAEGSASPTPKPTQHIPTTGYVGPIIFTSEPSPAGTYEPATVEHGPKNYPLPVIDQSLWTNQMLAGSYALMSAYCQVNAYKYASAQDYNDVEFEHPDEKEFWKTNEESADIQQAHTESQKRTGTYDKDKNEWTMNYQPSYYVKESPVAEKDVSFHAYIWRVRYSVPNYTIVRHDDQGKPTQELIQAYHRDGSYVTIYRDGRWWITSYDYLNKRMSADYSYWVTPVEND
ncbi:MAG: DUF6318 family protein [Rothia sp. (in: high G+C Gram-positive bacteria)]|uniref:DUF6318 family protein n=1 Tax=Rothia sp. (in: high G+C Gram-positive bacteria) TaxID=1885016 RepID=UPI0026DFAD79|nr:DUF6318 family protein [Rothia sp. (in: high G+C Gram-positive bacteria)]MDO5750868.1 DUF6318 family protein [Rothia sp. (in: high G+C Gram-positive bacteria)]